MSEIPELVIDGLKIDPKIFTFPFGCKCNGECCHYGVYTDYEEFELISSLKDRLIPLMDKTQTTDVEKWFEEPTDDADFKSGKCVGTELHEGKCVFLDKKGLCIIQRLAIEEGANPWKYKPLYCILFPLTIYEGSLTIDEEHIDRLKYCNKINVKESNLFDFCKGEIVHLLGEAGLQQLIEYQEKYFGSKGNA
jgi:Fe-S-cluster containining protein